MFLLRVFYGFFLIFAKSSYITPMKFKHLFNPLYRQIILISYNYMEKGDEGKSWCTGTLEQRQGNEIFPQPRPEKR